MNIIVSTAVKNLFLIFKQGNSDGWIESDVPIAGVNWARAYKSVTFGIGMWEEGFILTRKDGTRVNQWLPYVYSIATSAN